MSGKSKQSGATLSRLRDELAADVMSATEDEIFAEVTERGLDPEAAANRVGSILQRAVLDAGKQVMAAARASLHSERESSRKVKALDVAMARALLEKAARIDPDLQQCLTLAARNGEAMSSDGSLSDSDIQSLVEDLMDLGILKGEGD